LILVDVSCCYGFWVSSIEVEDSRLEIGKLETEEEFCSEDVWRVCSA
jgi:hypothetical protein